MQKSISRVPFWPVGIDFPFPYADCSALNRPQYGFGQSAYYCIGGGPIPGSIDIEMFEDPQTETIVMIRWIGGNAKTAALSERCKHRWGHIA